MGHIASLVKFATQLALLATLKGQMLFTNIYSNIFHPKSFMSSRRHQSNWRKRYAR